jgi:hypothetical protein
MYLLAARSGAAPRTIIVSVDLRLFQLLRSERPWMASWPVEEIEDAAEALGVPLVTPGKAMLLRPAQLMEWLSPAEFQRAFVSAAARAPHQRPFAAVSEVLPNPHDARPRIIRRTDGSLSFPAGSFRTISDVTPARRSGSTSAALASTLDGNGFRLLDALISRVRADGRQIMVLMPPYDPISADRLGIQPLLSEAEREIRHRAQLQDVPVVGSFDAGKCQCNSGEFRDPTHPGDTCFDHFLPRTLPP